MCKAQRIYREARKYLTRTDARRFTVALLEVAEDMAKELWNNIDEKEWAAVDMTYDHYEIDEVEEA